MRFDSIDAAQKHMVEMMISDQHDPEFVEELKIMSSSVAEEFGADLS